ncbi:MAG: hypothetical protein GY744_02570 [Gammaproteobacteria bacterium]|nr:hypothetical protein [Gammaproteobacteria bacterium]
MAAGKNPKLDETFFTVDDYKYYLDLIARYEAEFDVEVLAYCLMPNHVYFVVVPQEDLQETYHLFKTEGFDR